MSDNASQSSGHNGGTHTETLSNVVIRFAGDSGDGMQLTGNRFTNEAALLGNDLRTFPDFPAEIRAPAGTLAGVSAFQLSFSDHDIYTPGDALDVLVAMNPAALKVNLRDLRQGGILLVNTAQFGKRNLDKAGYAENPLENGSLDGFRVYAVDITKMTIDAIEDIGLGSKAMDRSKNFFALGLMFWLYNRALQGTIDWIDQKFGKKMPDVAEANRRALKAGYHFGETAEMFSSRYEVPKAKLSPGTYRNINGNKALAIGFIAAAQKSGHPLFLGSYPITPASDILHELSALKHFGVRTFQAEDEIAAVSAAIGAAFGGALALTTTSGPGIALKAEAMGLAVMVELPLVVVNVQRGGPSTGLPTKTEQADLLQALFGRNSESPIPVLAAATPSDCFEVAFEASRIALKYMVPVILLSDGYLANGAEPWRIPNPASLPEIESQEITDFDGDFEPYIREKSTLARPWPRLGSLNLRHRIGGLEKAHLTGGVSYDPDNHEFMVRLRAEKVARIVQEIPKTEIYGEDSGELLFVGWGSTYGAIHAAAQKLQRDGKKVSQVHIRHLNPLPPDLPAIMKKFKHVVIPELNLGQLSMLLRAETLIDIKSICKVQGQPFMRREIIAKAESILSGNYDGPFLIRTIEHIGAETPKDAEASVFARLS